MDFADVMKDLEVGSFIITRLLIGEQQMDITSRRSDNRNKRSECSAAGQ